MIGDRREAESRLQGAYGLLDSILMERRLAFQRGDREAMAVLDDQRREAFRNMRDVEAQVGEHFEIERKAAKWTG